MPSISAIAQIGLILAWYVVPSFATVPWYVIFLPTLIPLAVLGFMGAVALVVFLIACIVALFSR